MADDKAVEPDEASSGDGGAAENGDGSARAGGTAVRTRATMPKKRQEPDAAAEEPAKKGLARKRKKKDDDDREERTNPAQFVKQCVAELRKVVWPSGNQWQQYFVVVLIFVVFMITIVSLEDLGFGTLLLRLFG